MNFVVSSRERLLRLPKRSFPAPPKIPTTVPSPARGSSTLKVSWSRLEDFQGVIILENFLTADIRDPSTLCRRRLRLCLLPGLRICRIWLAECLLLARYELVVVRILCQTRLPVSVRILEMSVYLAGNGNKCCSWNLLHNKWFRSSVNSLHESAS